MQHFFLEEKQENKFLIPEDIYHQIKNVLRYKDGDQFIVVNNKVFFRCELQQNNANIIEEMNINNEPDNKLVLIIGSLKHKKIDMIVQKATEIGVWKIVILQMERSISNYKNNFESKIKRWEIIAKEAAEQSRRNIIPKICFESNIENIEKYSSKNNIVFYEEEKVDKIDSSYSNKDCTVLVGPEGGITKNEIVKLKSMNFKVKKLTNTILRAETACIYAVSKLIN